MAVARGCRHPPGLAPPLRLDVSQTRHYPTEPGRALGPRQPTGRTRQGTAHPPLGDAVDNELLTEIRDLLARLVELAEPQKKVVVASETRWPSEALARQRRVEPGFSPF